MSCVFIVGAEEIFWNGRNNLFFIVQAIRKEMSCEFIVGAEEIY